MLLNCIARQIICNWCRRLVAIAGGLLLFACVAAAAENSTRAGESGGVSAIWIFAYLSFTGMRAQNQGTTFWKVLTFIFGFPGTLVTLLIVQEGSERAYGIDMPRRFR